MTNALTTGLWDASVTLPRTSALLCPHEGRAPSKAKSTRAFVTHRSKHFISRRPFCCFKDPNAALSCAQNNELGKWHFHQDLILSRELAHREAQLSFYRPCSQAVTGAFRQQDHTSLEVCRASVRLVVSISRSCSDSSRARNPISRRGSSSTIATWILGCRMSFASLGLLSHYQHRSVGWIAGVMPITRRLLKVRRLG
jgi:hypothetical protein